MGRFIKFILVVLLMGSSIILAQENSVESQLNKLRGRRIPNSLLNEISVHIDNAPLRMALASISEKGGLYLSYNHGLLPLEKRVTVHLDNVYAIEALLSVLQQTSTMLQITQNGDLAIMPMPQTVKSHSSDIKGIIKGIVRDSSTGEPLPGANVMIKGTSLGAATDMKGEFILPKILPGNYTLVVTYIGFKTKELPVRVEPKKVINLEIELTWVAVKGKAVEITAQAAGQVKAINQQIASLTIKNVVSEARIKELPDANAAEALGRLPGVTINRSGGEASSVNVRGESGGANAYFVEGMRMVGSEGRGVDLSNIASSMIGGIELQKSFTPDQDGDISGGGVIFRLKDAEPGLKTDIIARQGYNGLTDSYNMRDISLTLSNRFFGNKLGILANLVLDQKDRSVDLLSAEFGNKAKPSGSDDLVGVIPLNGSFSRRTEMRKRLGLTYNIDYKIPNHKIAFSGFYAGLNRDVVENRNGVYRTPKRVIYSANKYIEDQSSLLVGLRGEHNLLYSAKLNWSTYYSGSWKKSPNIYGIEAENNSFDMSWNDSISVSQLYRQLGDQHDLLNTKVNETMYGTQNKNASESAFKLDLKVPFRLSNFISGYIKVGGKYRATHRKFIEHGRAVWYGTPKTYRVDGANLLDSLYSELKYQISPRYNILSYLTFAKDEKIPFKAGEDLKLYFPADWDILTKAIDHCKSEYRRDLVRESYNYDNSEHYRAGYIMAGINLGRHVIFTPGVRFESFRSKTDAFKYVADPSRIGYKIPGDIEPVSGTNKNDLWLPMYTLKIKPMDWFDIRASITKTLQRPGFESMSPRLAETTEFDRNYGNPNIQPAKSQNYDLYFSVYKDYIGLFTIGGFYKDIKDEINQVDLRILDPESMGLPDKYQGRTFSTPLNNHFYSWIKGLEIEWQTNFWYLPGFLNGFVFNINYTLLKTESKRRQFYETVKEISTPPFKVYTYVDSFVVNNVLNSPDQTLKLSLGYEKGGFSGRVSLFYQARAQNYIDPLFKNLNQATDELYRWDVQLSQKIIDGLTVYMNMNNIGNWPDQTSMMYWPDRLTSIENYGWSMDIGLRYRL